MMFPHAGQALRAAAMLAACLLVLVAWVGYPADDRGFGLAASGAAPGRAPPHEGGSHRAMSPNDMVFYTIGDWGCGSQHQHAVADAMKAYAAHTPPAFIVSLGDNFYNSGVQSATSVQFRTQFEEVYDGPSLEGVPWYLVLGDHDHRGSVRAQVDYSSLSARWHLDAPYYTFTKRKAPPGHDNANAAGESSENSIAVQFLMLDSIGLEGGFMHPGDHRRFATDYDADYAGKDAGAAQIKWLQDALADAEAAAEAGTWIVVVAHRPVESACTRERALAENRTSAALQKLLQHSAVSLYMNGHDHTNQLLRDAVDPDLHYLVNGAGGYRNLHGLRRRREALFADAFYGFCVHRVTPTHMEVSFVDTEGRTRRVHRIPKRGHSLAV